MNYFLKKVYQKFRRQALSKSGTISPDVINWQINEAKHQMSLAQKKLERGLQSGY